MTQQKKDGCFNAMVVKHHTHTLTCTIRDGIVHSHSLATTLECLKVADSVKNELLLLLAKDHLGEREREGGREGGKWCLHGQWQPHLQHACENLV